MNKSSITIGIMVYAEPARLQATLASISANTDCPHELLLLADGPDTATKAALAGLTHLRQSATLEARGAPACFNRLVSESDADVFVLLESGSMVGPGWLDHLLAALEADPRNGLAGPSTNISWNEQCVYPHAVGNPDNIVLTAREAVSRFGKEVRTLSPLHSLADFCYAVRRDVVNSIGAADEGYNLGPCWEMDYNIRAERAGFRAVWACAAYVHRSGFTQRRRVQEAGRFEANKHRYQDKFCGARIRGEKRDYREHCSGDACTNFAPPDLIQIHIPLIETSSVENAAPIQAAQEQRVVEQRIEQFETRPFLDLAVSEPFITCIMPTYDRRQFVPQAIRCFLRQDYQNAELLILDDGSDPIADCVPQHPRIRYIRLERKLTIGAKRNLACEQSRSDLIIHWDDDDWYPPWRLKAQVRALTESGADLCGSSRVLYYDSAANQSWEYRYTTTGVQWVGGNTLAYTKAFWKRNPFQDIQIGEDSRFLWSDVPKTVADLKEPSLCVASVHRQNTSPKKIAGPFWIAYPFERVRELVGDDLYFYRVGDWPLISCIMPTRNRRPFVSLTLRLFLGQDYPNKELVIIDDSPQANTDPLLESPGVRYIHLRTPSSIGAKRNIACRHANGDIIAHWDDDDWYSPDRLRYQAAPIVAGEADLTGLNGAYVLKLPDCDFWTLQPRLHERMFVGNVHGGTLVFSKRLLAEGVSYPEINLAEDAYLLRSAMNRGKRLKRLSNPAVFIYVRHGTNAWREFSPGLFIDPSGWTQIAPPPTFPTEALTTYREAAGQP
jgi:glycosyltransferase involved in cell wall biosynthesis